MTDWLDPLTLPLRGSRLIEASAGTGKTWTIAALYVRLVLGHGDGLGRPLQPGEILVMTFTRAATRELSDRIRRRLVQAAGYFRGLQPEPHDPYLMALRAACADADAREAAAWRLAAAAEAMDDAAIHTIDAWCQRMLREHAFDSGCLFDEELQADPAAMLHDAARDYWRQQLYPLDAAAVATALKLWRDVDALVASVRGVLDKPLPDGAGQGSLAACMAAAEAQQAQALAVLKQGWVQQCGDMLAWLEPLWARKDKPLDGKALGPARGRKWIAALAAWAAEPLAGVEALKLGTGAEKLTHTRVAGAIKPGHDLRPPACFQAFTTLMDALANLPSPVAAMRAHAAARIAGRLQQLKAQAGTYGFADMLNRLDEALDPARHGDHAQRLRQRILAQYPAALIDEFQDTSPVQLRIFDRLYRIAANDPAQALLLIGDPKQSIYGFRGADIHSYLQARRATAGRHEALGTNHRSSAALVAAVNGLFAAAEQRSEGAFLFRAAAADTPGDLPFVPVLAQGRADQLVAAAVAGSAGSAGSAVPPLQLCLDTTPRSDRESVKSRDLFAALCAERIVGLLNDAAAGFDEAGVFTRLRPADIAVLVRTGDEAAAVRSALRRRAVASVYLSDKDSVFAGPEAADLLRLLQAVAAPRDVRLARAALATALLDLPLQALLQLAGDDVLFDQRCELLVQWQLVWQTQGVLAMLRRALHELGLPARWLAGQGGQGGEGERRLSNVLHLAELLQAASAQLDGEQALIRWLIERLDDSADQGHTPADEQVLRLESDADLVQVVTVHKSKGLEYPLVFLPFATHHRADSKKTTRQVEVPDASGQRTLSLAPTEAQLAASDRVRLQQDLRLLYVALTRARHALWVGAAVLGASKKSPSLWHRSAIGTLVSGTAPRTPQQLHDDLQALAAAVPGLHIEHPVLRSDSGQAQVTHAVPRVPLPPLLPAPVYAAGFDRQWSISSYSALVKDARPTPGGASDMPARVLRDDEPAEADDALPPARPPAEQPWHSFPRGAFAGNFLHDQLEWLAGEGFALDDDDKLQAALRRRCERQGWGHRADSVVAWLRRVCSRPLVWLAPLEPPLHVPPTAPLNVRLNRPSGASLATLQLTLPEMEFWLPSDGLQAQAVDDLCRQHLLPGQPRPQLPERSLRGMLMGFADLVFEHQGRFGVLDYKSNALGQHDADYTPAAMAAAMLEHRYDVQAALYLLALHRLLKLRLGSSYAPGQHLHGAVHLFLRGVNSATGGCFHLPPPVALIEALDALLVVGAAA